MSAPLALAMYQEELRAWNWHINRVPVWDRQMGGLVGFVYITRSGDLVPESAERERLRIKYACRFAEYDRRNRMLARRSDVAAERRERRDGQAEPLAND
jgi:hypothetical protein